MENGVQVNAKRLLWAGFFAILAAGVGFGVRGGLFNTWAEEFGLNGAQLGAISLGAGFISFCFGIIIGGIIVDKIGYGKLILTAFALHVISVVVTFMAKPGMDASAAYLCLYWGTFIFGLANGVLEAVANPLVATLFPKNRNHYLNLLHASWPAGLVIGGMIGWWLGGNLGWNWKSQLALYLIPTIGYGVMFFGQKFPKSEASSKGLKLGEMFKDVGILGTAIVSIMLYFFLKGDVFGGLMKLDPMPAGLCSALVSGALLVWVGVITKGALGHWLLIFLFVLHALIGSVELGTDGWIQNITGAILSENEGKILFVLTSLTMFLLRFCAHFIETKIGLKPVNLLFTCSVLACLGLNLVSAVSSFGPALGALLVYAIGKTFFWPTMLAVASDRFPRTGAIAISFMGGIGMLSVGLLGGPGLGYAKDRFSANELKDENGALYEKWKSEGDASSFHGRGAIQPIDPKRLEAAKKKTDELTANEKTVVDADIRGNRTTLKLDSLIPAVMAIGYLFLIFYFRSIGGYKPLTVEEQET
ncbi:MAG: hypothetical protein CMP31_01535 [Roseibacillus sp.]|jgi:MFS family permease|nr:hypothetical protein [Roseibacillus sp.]MCP4741742.1 MFS transporter [Actinomycetales bacterium]